MADGTALRPVLLDPGVATAAAGGFLAAKNRDQDLRVLRSVADQAGWKDAILVSSGILAAAAARDGGPPDEERIAQAFTALLRDLASRYPADPDRIYVVGLAETASYAWYLGRALPGRWAGVFLASGRAAWGHRAIGNLRPVPVFAAHGTKDPYSPVAEARAACRALEALGGRVRFVEVAGGDTGSAYAKLGEALAWFAEQGPRDAVPRALDHRFSTARTSRAVWIHADVLERENDGFGRSHPIARVQAAVDGNTIRLAVEHATRLTLTLDPVLLDFAIPLRVEWNGATVFAGVVAPDLAAALRRFLAEGDARACGLAELTVEAPRP